jgi:pimeloyl-ACP methyl ester carboxylesterase
MWQIRRSDTRHDRTYRREIVNCEMKIIEDASHEHHLEKPEEYMEI